MSNTIAIVDKISSPDIASLLSIHPNDVTLNVQDVPPQWASWWTWAFDHPLEHPPPWLKLMHYFTRSRDGDGPSIDIPPQLCSLVDSVRSLQLQRTPSSESLADFAQTQFDDLLCDIIFPLDYETRGRSGRAYRISPKKEHEVNRMSSYIRRFVCSEGPLPVQHVVDVGSGQGYLSRELEDLGFHVLALDNNENQTSGANRWTKEAARKLMRERRMNLDGPRKSNLKSSSHPSSESIAGLGPIDTRTPNGSWKGSLTHRTVYVCPRTLEESIADWLIDRQGVQSLAEPDVSSPGREVLPVMMVALHACGSLTVDVLRTFLTNWARAPPVDVERAWTPHSLVVVGCCYNLMSPSDFPLSKPLRDLEPRPKLTVSAVHLAAQVPSQWLNSEDATRGADLALRKVVYRALLQSVLQAVAAQPSAITDHATASELPIQPGVGETLENRRLGKLNDKAYQDWPTFLEHAVNKLGIDLATIGPCLPNWFTHEAFRLKIESALYVLQTLRCILGPLIETLILLDRYDWIQNELAEMKDRGQEVEVEMVNLFDQATGSGRNVALVIKPATIPHKVCPMIERD